MARELSKRKFVCYINQLKEAAELRDKVNELFRNSRDNLVNDFMNAASLQICHEDIVVSLLEMIMDDDEKYPDISYFIYELDYGRQWKPGCIVDGNDEDIDISTPEKLYDYLMRNKRAKGDGNAV